MGVLGGRHGRFHRRRNRHGAGRRRGRRLPQDLSRDLPGRPAQGIAPQVPSAAAGTGVVKVMLSFAGQTAAAVSAVVDLVDVLTGIACGVFGGVIFGSVRENHAMSLWKRAPDPVSAGARVILRPFTRDDGYLRGLPPGGRAPGAHRGGRSLKHRDGR